MGPPPTKFYELRDNLGVITMADNDQKTFRLRFSEDVTIPDSLRRIRDRRLEGRFTTRAGAQLRDDGLWNTEVRATIQVKRQESRTTAHIQKPTYRLTRARPRFQ